MQSPAGLHAGPLEEFLALVIWQAARTRLRDRSSAIRGLRDAIEHGVVWPWCGVAKSELTGHEPLAPLGGVRLAHPAHELRDLGGAWLAVLGHAIRVPPQSLTVRSAPTADSAKTRYLINVRGR